MSGKLEKKWLFSPTTCAAYYWKSEHKNCRKAIFFKEWRECYDFILNWSLGIQHWVYFLPFLVLPIFHTSWWVIQHLQIKQNQPTYGANSDSVRGERYRKHYKLVWTHTSHMVAPHTAVPIHVGWIFGAFTPEGPITTVRLHVIAGWKTGHQWKVFNRNGLDSHIVIS